MNLRGKASRFFFALHGILLCFLTLEPALHAGPVTNLRFSQNRHDSLIITWDDDPGGDCYQVVFGIDPTFAVNRSSGLTQVNQNTTSYYGLQPNTNYFFKVKISSESDANYTAISTYTIFKSPGLVNYSVTGTSIFVNISANGLPAGTTYQVAASSDFSHIQEVFVSSKGPGSSLILSNLLYNTSYQVRLESLNDALMPSTPTLIASLISPPTAPILSVLVSSEVWISSITVRWDRNGASMRSKRCSCRSRWARSSRC